MLAAKSLVNIGRHIISKTLWGMKHKFVNVQIFNLNYYTLTLFQII